MESTAKKLHDKIKAKQTGRCMEGKSGMSSIPEDRWELMFPKKEKEPDDKVGE